MEIFINNQSYTLEISAAEYEAITRAQAVATQGVESQEVLEETPTQYLQRAVQNWSSANQEGSSTEIQNCLTRCINSWSKEYNEEYQARTDA